MARRSPRSRCPANAAMMRPGSGTAAGRTEPNGDPAGPAPPARPALGRAGAAALLPREPWFARLAAGVFYTWNPFVAERLIIGQWALLLGYAGLPWVLRAAHGLGREPSWRGTGRLALALLPAAVGGFAAMT